MTTARLDHPTLLGTLWPASSETRWLRAALVIALGSLLLTLTAHVKVPFWPVPMTMQTFAVLAIGMACGARLGVATVLAYLLQGALGMPVFAGGAGLVYMTGPTGGYLLGFVLAAGLTGWLAERGFDRSPVRTVVAMLLGDALILTLGVAWLATLIGLEKAIAAGLVPFLAAEGFKIALAAVVLPGVWKLLGRQTR